MRLKENKGITLIALVITIIVLLILAGVSIATLAGEHGILTQANNAKERTEKAKEEEEGILDRYNEFIEEKVGNSGGSIQGTEDTKPYLPEGSTVIEDNLSNGVVIKDKNNNEWAWVEVPKSIFAAASSNTDFTNIENDMITYASNYRQSGYTDSYYEGNGTSSETEYNSLKNKMLSSIYTNGGFWISRYEIGTDTLRTSSSDTLTTPVSKQDMYVYNYVTVSQAQSLASDMNPTTNKTTSLIFGIQWDLTMKYIESKGGKTQAELRGSSESWGNHAASTFNIAKGKYSSNNGSTYTQVSGIYTIPGGSAILLTTGATERNSVLNIYDLAGNVWELTIEKSSSSNVSSGRGGGNSGPNYPAGYRTPYTPTSAGGGLGFRTTLI